MTSYCQYTPDKKEQSTQNQTKICAIIVFYVYFVLYIELLFGDVGLNGSLKGETVSSIDLEDLNTGWKGVLNFTVRNGICYVSAWGVSHPDGTGASITVYDKMPKAAMNSGAFGELEAHSGSVDAFFFINYGTTLLGVHLNTTYGVYASFSYPILI